MNSDTCFASIILMNLYIESIVYADTTPYWVSQQYF